MRLKEFQKWLLENKIDIAAFFNLDGDCIDPNMLYFSGYSGFGALMITPKKAVLIAHRAEYERAKKTSRVNTVAAKGKLSEELKKLVKRRRPRIGIDKNRMTINFYKALKTATKARFVDVSGECLKLRAAKTTEEAGIIRKACKITDEIVQKTLRNFGQFKTESEVSAFLINETNKIGLTTSFKPIVASGNNACQAHHEVENAPLKKGFLIMDFGIRYKGYCSDISRTIYLGNPTSREIALYQEVLEVQTKLISQCKTGKSFIQIHQDALTLFGKHAKYFTHMIGHGVGTEIHENPNPKKTARRPVTKLLENSVITIEPGLYFAGKMGIRIEDDVLITKKGPEVLTKTGKNLLVIRK